MPELPEVETTRSGIEPHLVGRKVKAVLVREPRLRWPVSPDLGQSVTGQVIDGVSRRGKYLLVETRRGKVMIHLGMSGSLRILAETVPVEKHDHVDLMLDDKKVLRFRDPRRFGSIFWLPGESSHKLLDKLGPEPLEPVFDGEYLFKRSRNRKVAIKQFLMDSQVVVGVGNIYANEALFLAGIRPSCLAGKVSRRRYDKLVDLVKQVLLAAIESGGTTLKDFIREDGSPGYFKQSLNVYGRGGEPCVNCEKPLTEVRMGQRTTVFCIRCQK